MMKSILTTIAFIALAVSGLAQTRSVIVNTSGVVQSPTNFWSADVVNARSGLGLGTAATNPATAFQSSSLVLSNLSSSNGSALTNLTASNVTGTIAIINGGSGATTAGGARTNLGLGATNNVTFSNITANGNIFIGTSAPYLRSDSGSGSVGFYNSINDEYILSISNDTDPVVINSQWNDAGVRSNLGLGVTNNVRFNSVQLFQSGETTNSITYWIDGLSFVTGGVEYFATDTANGGSVRFEKPITMLNSTNVATTRTNLGLGLPALTNTNTSNFRTAIGLGVTNDVINRALVLPQADGLSSSTAYGIQWRNIYPSSNGLIALSGTDDQGQTTFRISTGTMSGTTAEVALFNANQITFYEPLSFNNTTNAATTRTNLGLGWAALTNTSASGFGAALYGSNTNPVLYNTNGEVVSPTNFWQVAPIVTRFVESQPTTNQTTNITAARNLHIHSLAISTTGVTNTIALPTNNVFNGDIALVVHEGPTSSVTQVRTQGLTNNLVTMNRTEEAVEFVYYNSVWQFNHNRSFVEPIYFSGTNAAGHAAESRTNLGLGSTNDVTFSSLTLSSDLTLGSGDNIVLSTTTGTKIGTATNQLLGFYNKTPITQPSSTGVTTNGFTTGSVSNVHANSTFTGGIGTTAYTISDVVAHLKSLGLLAP